MRTSVVRVPVAAAFLAAILTFPAAAQRTEVFVAPGGSDANPGTKAKPLRTLSAARDAVRRTKSGAPQQSLTVWLAGGQHRLSETVVFGLEDSAAPGQTITYAAMPGQNPVLSSDVAVRGWTRVETALEGLPDSARGKVWVAPVPEGVDRFNTLFDRQGMLPRARTAALKHERVLQDWRGPDDYHTSVPLPVDAVNKVIRPEGAEILAIGAAPWTMNILPVKSVDRATGLVQLAMSSTYALARPRFGFPAESIWVENTFAGLDAPGKWVLDAAARRIYLWPRANQPGNDIVAPRLVELLRVEGRIDRDGPADTPVRGLVFRGLTFTHGNRFASTGLTGLGLQHDWERFDESTALVRFRGAEECAVEQCRFEHTGGTAIRLDLHCRRNRITGNEIGYIGGAGVLLAGYGPGLKDVNRDNQITRNHIHHVGLLWWHSLAIWAWQSGHNRIANNHIHNVPYTAIAVTGRINWDRKGRGECSRTVRWNEVEPLAGREPWEQRERFLHGRENLIEYNDIHHVVELMHDGNGVYISGAGRGNVVRGNYVHDVPGVFSLRANSGSNLDQEGSASGGRAGEALRCDDDQHETLLEANVVFRFGALGVGFTSKGRNYIVNNIVACPPGRVSRGMISVEAAGISAGSRIERNILYGTQTGQPFQFRSNLAKGDPPLIQEVDANRNIYFNAADPQAAAEYLAWARKYGRENDSLQSDPLFEDAVGGKFRLRPDSPALKLGFQQVDLSKVGPSARE